MTQESKVIWGANNNNPFVTSLQYDAADRVRRIIYPDNEWVDSGYNDPRGVLNSVSGWSSYVSSTSYNPVGQITLQGYSFAYGNSAMLVYTSRSDNYRLERLQLNNAWYGSQLDLQYSYDAVGNLKTLTDWTNGGQVQTFNSDALNRLTSAATNAVGNGQYSESYSYNQIGNPSTGSGQASAARVSRARTTTGVASRTR